MSFDSRSQSDLTNLIDSIESSRDELEPWILRYDKCSSIYAGGRDGSQTEFDELTDVFDSVNEDVGDLITSRPRCLVQTADPHLQAEAEMLSLAMNQDFARMQLEDELHETAVDSQFFMGLVRVGRTAERSVRVNGRDYPLGQPFVRAINPRDWFHDTAATRFDERDYMGFDQSLPLDQVKESIIFRKAARLALQEDDRGDPDRKTPYRDRERNIRKYVRIREIWLPKERRLVTLAINAPNKPKRMVLRDVKWDGPELGPYIELWFYRVAGTTFPLAHATMMYEMAALDANSFHKLAQQIRRQKTQTHYRNQADAQRVQEGGDGEVIHVEDGEGVVERSYGGPNQVGLAAQMYVRKLFNEQAANPRLRSGGGIQAPTLGQEQLLQGNASRRSDRNRQRFEDFVRKIMETVGYYVLTTPMTQSVVQREIGDTGLTVSLPFSADELQGRWPDFKFELVPYSLHSVPPREQAQFLIQMMTQIFIPMGPMLEQQGMRVRLDRFVRKIAEFTGVRSLTDCIEFIGQQQAAPQRAEGRAPANTTRTQVRMGRRAQENPGDEDMLREFMQAAGGALGQQQGAA